MKDIIKRAVCSLHIILLYKDQLNTISSLGESWLSGPQKDFLNQSTTNLNVSNSVTPY